MVRKHGMHALEIATAEENRMAFGVFTRLAAAAAVVVFAAAAQAQSPADFYKGRNVDLYVGYSVGGGYDLYARVLARHIGRHIPGNPTIVVKNMEGAGSLRLANWLYRVAPKDGSVFAIIGRGTGFDPLLGQQAAQFDGNKFTWLGSGNHEVSVCVAFEGRAGVTKFDDLQAKEMTVGGTGASADTDQFPRVLNGVLGTRMKVVSGYPGGNDIVLAMERGELQGRCGWSWSSVKATHGSWIAEKKLNILVQLSLHKHPDLPDVPLVVDLAKTDEERQILTLIFARQVMGRPFLAPPGIPADRAEALRKAFMETMTDPAFVADAEKSQLEVNPVAGDDLQKLVAEIYRTPPEVAKKAAQLLAVK
jgi:tripartite-type tricarboxylate transporter receptor subunit TctC